jgi:ribonuclease P protein component
VPARTVGRIQTRAAFRQLQRTGRKGSCGPVRASFVPVDTTTPGVFPQVGYVIGKRCGNAVTRNMLRRRLREASRAAAAELPAGFYLLRADPSAATRPGAQLMADAAEALRRAAQVKVAS